MSAELCDCPCCRAWREAGKLLMLAGLEVQRGRHDSPAVAIESALRRAHEGGEGAPVPGTAGALTWLLERGRDLEVELLRGDLPQISPTRH